jgi:hypothetical protein
LGDGLPEVLDLAQFPRLSCRRCGLVTLIDPAVPADARGELTCARCTRPLFAGTAQAGLRREWIQPRGTGTGPGRSAERVPGGRPSGTPSHAVVGLALAGLAMMVLGAWFVFLALTPHHNYWQFLTR